MFSIGVVDMRTNNADKFLDTELLAARNKFYPGWWTLPDNSRTQAVSSTYILVCVAPREVAVALAAKPPNVRVKIVAADRSAQERDRSLVILRAELRELFEEPDNWLNTPNEALGGRPPLHFLGSVEEIVHLREIFPRIKHGFVT